MQNATQVQAQAVQASIQAVSMDETHEGAALLNSIRGVKHSIAAGFLFSNALSMGNVKALSCRDWAAVCFEAGKGHKAALFEKTEKALAALGADWSVAVTAKGRPVVSRFGMVFERPLTDTEKAENVGKRGKPRSKAFAVVIPGRLEILGCATWNAAEAALDTFHLAHGRAWVRPFVRPLSASEMVVTEVNGGKAHKDKDGKAKEHAHKVTRLGWMPQDWMEWR